MRVAHGAIAAIVVSGLGANANAAPQIVWHAPPECPTAADVRAALLRAGSTSATEQVRAVANITRTERGFDMDLSVGSQSGSAAVRLSSAQCDVFASVFALEVALAADAGVAAEQLGPPRLKEAQGSAELGGGVVVGPLPAAAPAVRAHLSLEAGPVVIDAGAAHLFSEKTRYVGGTSALGANFDATLGFVALCSPLRELGFGLAACAGVELGVLHGAGFGATQTFSSTQLWAAATISPVIRYGFGDGFFLTAACEGGVALGRAEFHARGLPTLFRPDRTSLGGWLGVGHAL